MDDTDCIGNDIVSVQEEKFLLVQLFECSIEAFKMEFDGTSNG